MQVSWDWFEHAICYFTNLVYSSIRFAVGSGEAAPFVGHNAFIRWSAVHEAASDTQEAAGDRDAANDARQGGYTRFWSESNVSEDFDMALRLQINGYVLRLADYHGGEFKEGISLTIFDELNRWEKYAYGCSELVFHPFLNWYRRGPITPLFRKFLGKMLHKSVVLSTLTAARVEDAALFEDDRYRIHLAVLRPCVCFSSWCHELLHDRMEEWRYRQVRAFLWAPLWLTIADSANRFYVESWNGSRISPSS